MSTIQRYPGGLLELLAAKTSGWTPGELVRNVQPSLDLFQFLAQTDVRHETANNAAAAENDSVTIQVPSDEWWVLFAAGMEYLKTATMTLAVFSIRMSPLGSSNWCSLAQGPVPEQAFGSTGAAQVSACVFVPPQPWLLSPGTTMYGRVDVLGTDATVDVGLNLRVSRLT
jgi:hypothetical protein